MDNFNLHTEYYFWDKKNNCLGHIRLSSRTSSHLYFTYHGVNYRCKVEYAKGKLFENRTHVAEYMAIYEQSQREKKRLEHHKEVNTRHISTVDVDARVIFGD